MRHGNRIPAPKLAMGFLHGSPMNSIRCNVYTEGLAGLNSNGINRVLTLADDELVYDTVSDTHTAVTTARSSWNKCHNGTNIQSLKSFQTNPVVRPQQKCCSTRNTSNLLQWRS